MSILCHRFGLQKNVPRAAAFPSLQLIRGRFSSGHNYAKRASNGDYEKFYRYDSGRWLWDEEEQLRKRYNKFDVPKLQKLAARYARAGSCSSMVKIAEDGLSRVFRLVMNNGKVVIARLPYPHLGQSRWSAGSEAATITFASRVLGIPTPHVLKWASPPRSPIGPEFILTVEAKGSQLSEIWGELGFESKRKIVNQVIEIQRKLLSTPFTQCGSLCFARKSVRRTSAEVVADFPEGLKEGLKRRFAVGPTSQPDFWTGERMVMSIDRGPWTHPSDYLKAIAKREIAWLESHATSELLQHPLDNRSRAQKSPAAHVKLYKKFLEIADHILPQGELSKPVLWHCDLRPANIFVKNDRITSIVNWQHAWVGPLFMQARHPQLVAYDGEMMLHLPDRCEQPDKERDHEEKKRLQDQVERSLILRHYERGIRKASPLMNEIMSLPHGQTRHDLVTFAENTWNGDIIPFRKSLALVTRKWKKIIGPMPCPVSFTQKQVNAHLREGEGWMKHADFWESKQGLITRDGWTTNELYESLKKQYEEYTTRKASRKGVNPLRNLVWRDGL